MKKMNYLVKQVIAHLKGDEAEKTALNIQKNANAAIEQEIAILKANLLTFASEVESVEAKYNNALINNGNCTNFNHKGYIEHLTNVYNSLQEAKKNESTCKKKIEYFTEVLNLINKDVE